VTFVIIQEIDGMDAETYEEISAVVAPEGDPPNGLVFHAAGPAEDGWRVVEAWESADAFEQFREERLDRASDEVFQRRGTPPAALRIVFFEAHNVLQP
jgi:hypothetical protein